MTHDADLCTALRRCQFCDDTGKLLGKLSKEAVLPCPHCRLTRMAADRIEHLIAGGCTRGQRTTQFCAEAQALSEEVEQLRDWQRNVLETSAAAEIAKRVRERCAQACANYNDDGGAGESWGRRFAEILRSFSAEDLLKP